MFGLKVLRVAGGKTIDVPKDLPTEFAVWTMAGKLGTIITKKLLFSVKRPETFFKNEI